MYSVFLSSIASSIANGIISLTKRLEATTNQLGITVQFGNGSNWCSNLYLRVDIKSELFPS